MRATWRLPARDYGHEIKVRCFMRVRVHRQVSVHLKNGTIAAITAAIAATVAAIAAFRAMFLLERAIVVASSVATAVARDALFAARANSLASRAIEMDCSSRASMRDAAASEREVSC